jgi:transposase-like protein
VETLAGHKQQALSELGIARSTYYRWWRQWQRGDVLELHSEVHSKGVEIVSGSEYPFCS